MNAGNERIPMRVVDLDASPIFTVSHRNAKHRRGQQDAEFPTFRARVDSLTSDLDALFVTSDLQGRCFRGSDSPDSLLGLGFAESLHLYCIDIGLDARRVGVVLGGDLFAHADLTRLGGNGDVREVWRAFAAEFAYVAGVAGNHDSFGASPRDLASFACEDRIHLLDPSTPGLRGSVATHGMRIAGVSGVVGDPARPWRKSEEEFRAALSLMLEESPDLLVLHQNPSLTSTARPGSIALRELLASSRPTLVAFGHSYSPDPLIEIGSTQLLATEGRAFLLQRT